MLRGERPSLDGKWYTVTDAINEPPPIRRVPVMIGGSGERKTFRMVAQYADSANIICPVDQISHKLDVIAGHCETHGRDRSSWSSAASPISAWRPLTTRPARA